MDVRARLYDLPLIKAEINEGERYYRDFRYGFDLVGGHPTCREAIAWCCNRFGVSSMWGDWLAHPLTTTTVTVWFRTSAQAVEFKLRWV
jgi:hypothetical protein